MAPSIRKQWIYYLIFVGIFLIFPFSLFKYTKYILFLVNMTAIGVIGASGLNILTGFTGLISLGQASFMGVGAYTVAILTSKLGLPFYMTLLAAGLMTMAVGVIVGTPSLRLGGFYLAMATLASEFLLEYVFKNWESLTYGLQGFFVTPPKVFGIYINNDRVFYFLSVTLAIMAVFCTRNLFRTKVGRAFIAIRDRDIAAELIGINIFKYKLFSFAISSFYTGVAGGLWCYYMTIINPEAFQLSVSIDYIAMIIVGGMGTISGPIYGSIFVNLLPEVIQRLIELLQSVVHIEYTFAAIKQIAFGSIIAIFLILEPRGLSEVFTRLGKGISQLRRKEVISDGKEIKDSL